AVTRLTERSGDNDLYLVDVDSGSGSGSASASASASGEVIHVSPHEDEARYSSPSWLPDSSAFFFSTDQGRDLSAIAPYDIAARPPTRWSSPSSTASPASTASRSRRSCTGLGWRGALRPSSYGSTAVPSPSTCRRSTRSSSTSWPGGTRWPRPTCAGPPATAS